MVVDGFGMSCSDDTGNGGVICQRQRLNVSWLSRLKFTRFHDIGVSSREEAISIKKKFFGERWLKHV